MKQRVEEMEREAKKLRELQAAAEGSTSVEQPEGDEGSAMETEDEKALIDSRSVFVGNVSDSCPHSTFPSFPKFPRTSRSIIVRRPKTFRPTFKRVVPSTVSPSFVTNLQVTPKGNTSSLPSLRDVLIHFIHRFAYVEFAEPEFIDPALALDNSLFHGRLIKVCLDH
jgi:hypothetical protein